MSSKRAVVHFHHPLPPIGMAVCETPDGEELTLYPEDVPEHDLMTHWVTAAEGSYVATEDCR